MNMNYQKNAKRRYKGTIVKLNMLKRLAVTDCAALEMLSFPHFKGTAVLAFTGRGVPDLRGKRSTGFPLAGGSDRLTQNGLNLS